ncbi:MAG: hypothetical protein M3460_27540 [Actinomycetota bacterium]|nr:hypothetical protein [Actinomycetota bacterium]
MVDELTERYGDLLAGSYDCVDRIVLNGYFSLGHNPGGFRVWWRRLHGDTVNAAPGGAPPASHRPPLTSLDAGLATIGARGR